MGSSTKALVLVHADQIKQNDGIDMEKVHKIEHLYEFDRDVQCPTWGYVIAHCNDGNRRADLLYRYPTFWAYHRDASSSDAVLDIRIPLMALHAVDDPIANDKAVPYDEISLTPYVVLVATSGGGHLSWFEFGGERWHAKPVSMQFFCPRGHTDALPDCELFQSNGRG